MHINAFILGTTTVNFPLSLRLSPIRLIRCLLLQRVMEAAKSQYQTNSQSRIPAVRIHGYAEIRHYAKTVQTLGHTVEVLERKAIKQALQSKLFELKREREREIERDRARRNTLNRYMPMSHKQPADLKVEMPQRKNKQIKIETAVSNLSSCAPNFS